MLVREFQQKFKDRLQENRKFIQCIVGPRQIGKTTMVISSLKELGKENSYNIASDIDGSEWIATIWEAARVKLENTKVKEVVIAIDEIQKIGNWSEIVKKEWDVDTVKGTNIKLVILGSSRLLIQKGLTESLAGRFELIQMTHWSFKEMNTEFGLSPEEFAWFGGYPGSVELMKDEFRWKNYIYNSLIETTISQDILMLTRIDKPALLRQLFHLASSYSGQMISYTKLLGQLQDAGNTTTLSHYMSILESAGLITGLQKIYKEDFRKRASIPKLQVFNTALISGQSRITFEEAKNDPIYWGRIVESCVGAHLINNSIIQGYEVLYWRHSNNEVDFVLKYKDEVIGIEVKSSIAKRTNGMSAFNKAFKPKKVILIENRTLPWWEFIRIDPVGLF